MTDLADLELDKPTGDPDDSRGRRRALRVAIVAGVLVAPWESATLP